MEDVLLVYASMSGNTEAIADIIEEVLKEHSVNVRRAEVYEIDTRDIESVPHIIFGSYTWGDGELPDDFLDFYDEMDEIDFTNKKVAVFGSGDTSYDIFCGAVDLLEEKVKKLNGTIMVDGLKVELAPFGEDVETCKEFAVAIVNSIRQTIS
ncbi:flavodoxin [Priestia megaterium]|nr:flavodoxin [Priestia megaterium]